LWDAESGRLIHTFEGHTDGVNAVAFSPDGMRLLSGSGSVGEGAELKLWDAASGQLLRTFDGHSRGVTSVAFSPDGTRLLSGSNDNTLKLWDTANGQPVRTLQGHFSNVRSVAFSSDGTHLLSGSDDKTLKLWDAASGKLIRTLGGGFHHIAFSRDGAHVVWTRENTMGLWDTGRRQLIQMIRVPEAEAVSSVALSPDGSLLLSRSFVVRSGIATLFKLWDVASGQLVRTLEGHGAIFDNVVFSHDGKHVIAAGFDGIKLWDTRSGQLIRTFAVRTASLESPIALSPNGAHMAIGTNAESVIGTDAETIEILDAASGNRIRTLAGADGVRLVAYSPDGTRLLSGGWKLRMWDAATGHLLHTFEAGPSVVASAAFSLDGSHVVSASSNDHVLKLWEAATGRLLRSFSGHTGRINSIVFSADGSRLVSCADDGTVRIWDTATGAQLAMLVGGRDGEWLMMTPAGFFAASRKATEMLSIVRGFEHYSVMQFYDHLYRPDLVAELLNGDPLSLHRFAAGRLNLERILESGPIPTIERLPDRTELKGQTAKIAVRFIDQGGGIGPKVIWRVNGRTQGKDTARGLGGPSMLGNYVTMEQTLTVDPREKNEVEIIAYNGKGLLATPPLKFSIDPWGVQDEERPRPRLFILAAGVGRKYLPPFTPLQYAAKDAQVLAEALKAAASERVEGRPLFEHVEVKTLLEEQVTERNLAAEFDRLSGIVKPSDVFVLFLGGHGVSDPEQGWVFIPQDLNTEAGHRIEKDGILDAKLKFWLREKIHAKKTLLIFDACESAAARSLERQTVMSQLEHAMGAPILSAAPAGKAAYESSRLGHGVLTYAILEALHRPEGAASNDVTVWEIAKHVSRRVPVLSQREFGVRQIPHFSPGNTEGDRRDDFPLGLRTVVLKELAPQISTAATHVNLARLKVFKEPGGKGGVVLQLQPLTSITLIKSERGWAHIGRDGKALGYVRERQLSKLN
jgi:WD40 repeat protein